MFQIGDLDGIYAQAALVPCIGHITDSGHMLHLDRKCPEVGRLAALPDAEARDLYEAFRVEANSWAITQRDADLLHQLYRAAAAEAVKLAPRQRVDRRQDAPKGAILLEGSDAHGWIAAFPTPASRALRALADWCGGRSLGHIGPHMPASAGSTGEDWFDERG